MPEHFRLDFLHARQAVDTRFFHVLVEPLAPAVLLVVLVVAGAAVELEAWAASGALVVVDIDDFLPVNPGGGLLWSEIGEGPVVIWRWSEVISAQCGIDIQGSREMRSDKMVQVNCRRNLNSQGGGSCCQLLPVVAVVYATV